MRNYRVHREPEPGLQGMLIDHNHAGRQLVSPLIESWRVKVNILWDLVSKLGPTNIILRHTRLWLVERSIKSRRLGRSVLSLRPPVRVPGQIVREIEEIFMILIYPLRKIVRRRSRRGADFFFWLWQNSTDGTSIYQCQMDNIIQILDESRVGLDILPVVLVNISVGAGGTSLYDWGPGWSTMRVFLANDGKGHKLANTTSGHGSEVFGRGNLNRCWIGNWGRSGTLSRQKYR